MGIKYTAAAYDLWGAEPQKLHQSGVQDSPCPDGVALLRYLVSDHDYQRPRWLYAPDTEHGIAARDSDPIGFRYGGAEDQDREYRILFVPEAG